MENKNLSWYYLIPIYGLIEYFKDANTDGKIYERVIHIANMSVLCGWNIFVVSGLEKILESLNL